MANIDKEAEAIQKKACQKCNWENTHTFDWDRHFLKFKIKQKRRFQN